MFGMTKMMITIGGASSPCDGITGSYEVYTLSMSPVSYWRLGEIGAATVAVDEQGVNDGTYVSSPDLDSASLIPTSSNTSMTLTTASADKMTIPVMSLLRNYSVSLLINVASSNGLQAIIHGSGGGWYIQNGYISYRGLTDSSKQLNTGETYHIVMIDDNGTGRVYVNGIDETGSVVTNNNFSPSSIGVDSTGGTNPLGAIVDEIAIFDRALTQEEAEHQYLLSICDTGAIGEAFYWRITVTDNNGGDYVGISQIEFLLSSVDQTVPENVSFNVISSSSQVNSSNTADYAFNDLFIENQWTSALVSQGSINEWIQYQSLVPFNAGSVSIRSNTVNDYTEHMPKDFIIQKSNNGTDWVTVRTVTGSSGWSIGEKRTFAFM